MVMLVAEISRRRARRPDDIIDNFWARNSKMCVMENNETTPWNSSMYRRHWARNADLISIDHILNIAVTKRELILIDYMLIKLSSKPKMRLTEYIVPLPGEALQPSLPLRRSIADDKPLSSTVKPQSITTIKWLNMALLPSVGSYHNNQNIQFTGINKAIFEHYHEMPMVASNNFLDSFNKL